MLNHIVRKPVRKHLPWQRRDRDARRLALQDVAEMFKVAVAPADGGGFEGAAGAGGVTVGGGTVGTRGGFHEGGDVGLMMG